MKFCPAMVCMTSKWPKVFPSLKADAQAVVKALLMHIIPTLETPEFTELEKVTLCLLLSRN